MKSNSIAYPNLRAEMGRKGVGISDIASALNFNRDTLSRKLSKKSPIYLNEAFEIQVNLFPDCDIRYLFASQEEC